MEEFKGKSNQELKEELNNLNEMQEFLKDEIDDEDMKKEYDDNQEKIDYLTKVVSDEPISVPEPSSEPQMDETILVSEKEMGKPKDIKVPEIPKDLFFADGGITKKYFVPRYVKDKISPNFLNVYIDYPTPSGVQVAYGKETMSGQQRRLGSEKAMNIAKDIVKDIKEKHRHNLEDIDYFDNERGKVTIFAVSDDFEDTNFALGGYLTSAGIGAYYGAKNPKSVKKVTDPIDKAISQIGKNLTDKKFAKGGVLSSDEKKKIEEHISYIHQEDIDVEHLPTNKEYVEAIIEEKIVDKSKREAVEKYISDRDKSRKEYVDYWKEEDFAKGGSVVSPSGIVYVVRGRDKKGFVIAEEIAYSTKDAEKKSIKMTLEDKGNKIVDIKTEIFKPKKYAKGGEIKVGDYVSVNAGYGMKHIGKVNSKHHLHNDRVYVDGIGDALEIKRLTKVKPPSMADGGKIDEKRERVIDYFINNEEEEELISRMGGNGEEFLEDRDGNYDEIYERINDNYNNEDIDELFNEYLGYAKGGEVEFRKLANSKNFDIVTPDGRYEIEMGAFGIPKSIIDGDTRKDINTNPIAIKYRGEIQEYIDANSFSKYAKGGELDDILGKLDKVRNEFVDLKLKSDLNTEEGVAKFRKKAEPLKKQERKLEDKLEQMGEQEYSLPFAKGGATEKDQQTIIQEGTEIEYVSEDGDYSAIIGYQEFFGRNRYYIWFNGKMVHSSITYKSMLRKLNQLKKDYKLEYEGVIYAKGGMTGFNKFFDKFKRSDAYISEPMKTAKGNYRVEVDPYDKETSKKMKDYMQSEGIGYSPKPMGKGFYTQFAKGGKLRNTEYNLRTFFTFDGEDFAIFGGHLYGAREGDNEFMLIDNINYAPKEVQVAYYEKMKGFAKGGTTKDYSYDYEDIGQFSMNRESWGNYTNKQFEKIGKDIVENDYDGNIKKAYDSIVRKTLYPKKFAKGGRVRYMLNGFEENLNYILDSTNGVEVAREGSKEDGDLVIYFETKDEDYAKGGETASPITNYHKNFMGTLSFDLKVKGMRKPQDFIVYPITGKTNIIRIQSDKKWGEIDVTTGKGILSKTGNNSWAFALDVSNRNVNKFDLTPEELEELKSKIRETSGKEVGNVIITTDNSGAELLEEGGVLDMNEVEIYEGPDDNYTIVMKGDVYGMNTQTLPNLSINMYEGDRSEYPSDISHWGKKMKFDDAPIVIKEKIEMRKEEYKEGGRIMSEKDEDIEVMERLIADEKDEDIKIELQKELEKLKNK